MHHPPKKRLDASAVEAFLPPSTHRLFRMIIASPRHGAEIQFRGVVRALENGRTLRAIRYSAYAPMAEAKLAAIAQETLATWPAGHIFLQHRLGEVPVGHASVLIATAMPHSADAYALSQHILHRLKTEVPIWKEMCWSGES
jgi:molybdopterin synthase catalytic subunit